jgi:predicted nucleic acid-binding protein
MTFVLDASVALLWFVPQTNPKGIAYAQATLMALKEGQAVVPSLCALEIANVMTKLEAKGIVEEVESQRFVALFAGLNIETDLTTGVQALGDILQLARRFKLSAYDATYLELSMRKGLPLATLDTDLTKAAITAGVAIFGKP